MNKAELLQDLRDEYGAGLLVEQRLEQGTDQEIVGLGIRNYFSVVEIADDDGNKTMEYVKWFTRGERLNAQGEPDPDGSEVADWRLRPRDNRLRDRVLHYVDNEETLNRVVSRKVVSINRAEGLVTLAVLWRSSAAGAELGTITVENRQLMVKRQGGANFTWATITQ